MVFVRVPDNPLIISNLNERGHPKGTKIKCLISSKQQIDLMEKKKMLNTNKHGTSCAVDAG